MVRDLELPQTRHRFTVLGNRAAGAWGYQQGVNEHGVAAGATSVFSRVECDRPGLMGPDLVRLVLERASNALQGIDLATDLIARHGQGGHDDEDGGCRDCALLIADRREAYLLSAAGSHWAVQEVAAVRAATSICHLRQDWNRVSRGLSDLVLERGWWPEDGSKIDFEGTVGEGGPPSSGGLRRWGHATLLLEEQNGHIDGHFLRRLLSDHYEGCLDEADPCYPQAHDNTLCQHASNANSSETAVSLIADLGVESRPTPIAWWAFGPPCQGVYFPIVFAGDLPAEFSGEGPGAIDSVWRRTRRLNRGIARDPGRRQQVCEMMSQLQTRFDQAAHDYLDEADNLRQHGDTFEMHRLATAFMQHNLERFEEAWLGLLEESRAGLGLAATPG
jgi:secernin